RKRRVLVAPAERKGDALVSTAFVTGGSGFIGGRLIDRLVREGWRVRALARSDSSAAKVSERGAEAVPGDLDDAAAMRAGAEGCEYAFHAAAHLGEWGTREEFERDNVGGTRNALEGSRAAGVRRFVHVGTEAALLAGEPLVNVNEEAPLRPDSKALYPATKAMAEQAVRNANGDGFETGASEAIWRTFRLKGNPPVTRLAYWLSAQECTIDISRARAELAYQPTISREEGLAALRSEVSRPAA